jgi:hypothetical protein
MGVMTISLKKEDDENVRKLAKLKYGNTKGAIARTIAEAVQRELSKEEDALRHKRLMELMQKGVKIGWTYKNRNEFYD